MALDEAARYTSKGRQSSSCQVRILFCPGIRRQHICPNRCSLRFLLQATQAQRLLVFVLAHTFARMNPTQIKVGILGGGQLGKMLSLAAHNWDLDTWVLDKHPTYPAGSVCSHFVEGDFKSYDDVYRFGKLVDVLTIEIEHVNVEAMRQLQTEGLTIHPDPQALATIKDKGLQRQFYQNHGFPVPAFQIYEDAAHVLQALQRGDLRVPFVQKSRTAGYDGQGVAIIRNERDLDEALLDCPSVVEDLVDIDKELAVVVAHNARGEVKAFPVVEMVFNPVANLVEYLSCPANIDDATASRAEKLAVEIIDAFEICGLLAVELFLTRDGALLVNEVAPRPHNSGHHTIDSCYTSQFEQHLRGILNLPLGSTRLKTAAVMVNLLGEPGYTGKVHYEGIEHCLRLEGVNIHLYGKQETRPFRKMGHLTVVADTVAQAFDIARRAKATIKVISKQQVSSES